MAKPYVETTHRWYTLKIKDIRTILKIPENEEISDARFRLV